MDPLAAESGKLGLGAAAQQLQQLQQLIILPFPQALRVDFPGWSFGSSGPCPPFWAANCGGAAACSQ